MYVSMFVVCREELNTAFYGNILKNFSRGLKVAVSGKSADFCEVTVSHGLVCRYSFICTYIFYRIMTANSLNFI